MVRASRNFWQETLVRLSGGGDAFRLDYTITGIIALHPHPFLDMIHGHAQQDKAVTTAQITLEQETGLIAQQPACLIHSSANIRHAVSLSRP